MFKQVIRNRLGLSPVISSIIMVAAVITMGLIVVAWTGATFEREQTYASDFFSDRSELIKENFVIEDVWFNSSASPDTVDITIRNVGTVDLKIVAIHFNGTILTQEKIITTGNHETIVVNSITWNPGDSFYLKVISARGQQIRESYSTTG